MNLRTQQPQITNYHEYKFSKKEGLFLFLRGIALCVIIGFLFYKSLLASILLLPLLFLLVRSERTKLTIKRKFQLNIEFRDGLSSLSCALEAGYSIEHALEESVHDLLLLYNKKSLIIQEFELMIRQIKNNCSVEDVFLSFAARTGIDDIECFSAVFSTAKRSGGDLIQIIRDTERVISEKVETNREIRTMIAAKQFEAKIMQIMPLGIILYLDLCNPSFLNPLYHGWYGRLIMTVLLLVYAGCVRLSQKITEVTV